MTVTTIDLFNILRGKLGEREAKALVEYVETQVKEMIEENMAAYITKSDLRDTAHGLELKIEKTRSDMIKWMFVFWVGQISITIALFLLFLK
jgi:hypothetical protein